MISLKILKNELPFKDIDLQDHETLNIGRSRQNNLMLDDSRLSRNHCTIYFEAGQWKIKDFQSPAGTMVNGQKIAETVLAGGDTIKLCDFTIRIEQPAVQDSSSAVRSESVQQPGSPGGTVFMPRSAAMQGENRIEVIAGKAKGLSKSFCDSMIIGRKPGCDLVIEDQAVSREHMQISRSGKSYSVENLNENNSIEVNGKIIKKFAPLATNAIIKIGDTTLKVTLSGSQQKTLAGSKPFSTGLNRKFITIGLPALLFVVFLAVLFTSMEMKSGQDETLSLAEKTGAVMVEPGKQREINLHMKRGKDYFEKNNYREALTRFQAVLDISPTDTEALSYVKQCEIAVDKENREKLKLEEKKDKIKALFAEAAGFCQSGKYAEARSLLAEAKNLDPSNSEINGLLQKIDAEQNAFKAKLEEEEKRKAQYLSDVKDFYARGEAFFAQNEYYQALKAFNNIIALNVPCDETTRAQRRVEDIKAKLLSGVEASYNTGLKYYNLQDYDKALMSFKQVVEVYPGYKNTNELMFEIEKNLGEKARILYQEGLVYEDIGNMDAATKRWREVLKIMPVTSNEYYKKALFKLSSK